MATRVRPASLDTFPGALVPRSAATLAGQSTRRRTRGWQLRESWRVGPGTTQVEDTPSRGVRPGAPGSHHQGGVRMGADPKISVVNKYAQSWDIPNLFVIGSSTFPSMSGFNPTLTIQALAYMGADAIVNRYRKNPGALL